MLVILSLFVSGCTVGNKQNAKDLGLNTVTDSENLKSLVKETKNRPLFDGVNSWLEDDSASPKSSDRETDYTSTDYTKTNVQVEGVDEGDIIKTDGSRIYIVSWNRLQVIKLLGKGQMELVLNEKITPVTGENYNSYTYYSDLYVTDKYLVVTGQKMEYSYHILEKNKDDADNEEATEPVLDYYPYYYNYIHMSIVDIYDIETLVKVDSYQITGYIEGSRLIKDNLYLISNYQPNYYDLKNEETDIRPWYIHNGEAKYFDYSEIKYLPDSFYQAFNIITTINLGKERSIANDVFLSASYWGQIYVSPTAIYFAANYYTRSFINDLFGTWKQKGLLFSFQINSKTGEVSFGGAGEFEGIVINQFAMDEYNGYMRLATTDGWGEDVVNRLYVFERKLVDEAYKLEVVGKIDSGLGKPGESIQSVRFNKDIATIVTFLRTDPFYTVDLKDPYNPKIIGALEIPGFSTYQHPWTDTLILGIGFDAVDGRTTGMKLALYDITDQENPVEVGKPLILSNGQNSWSYSEATWNHKAIMIDKTRNCFGFTLWRSNWDNYYYSSTNDYVIFSVDETKETPITLKYSFSHINYFQQNKSMYEGYYWRYDFAIKRAFRVDDYLYVISGEVATSHNLLGDLSVVDDIIFEKAFVDAK